MGRVMDGVRPEAYPPCGVDLALLDGGLPSFAALMLRRGAPSWFRLVGLRDGVACEGPTALATLASMVISPRGMRILRAAGDRAREPHRVRAGGLLTRDQLFRLADDLVSEEIERLRELARARRVGDREPAWNGSLAGIYRVPDPGEVDAWLARLDKTEDGQPFNVPLEAEVFTSLEPSPQSSRQYRGQLPRPEPRGLARRFLPPAKPVGLEQARQLEKHLGALAFGHQLDGAGRRRRYRAVTDPGLRDRWAAGEFRKAEVWPRTAYGTRFRPRTGEVVDDG